MENFAELMQRLLEIQSGEKHRSPELIAEDERLMDGLRKRTVEASPEHQPVEGFRNGRVVEQRTSVRESEWT